MFSVPVCFALFALESAYIGFLYDPDTTHSQVGIPVILACEAMYLVRIGQQNVLEKKSLGKVSKTTRLYSAMFILPVVGAAALACGLWSLQHYVSLWVALFFASACGKIGWYRNASYSEIR